ncbi:TonB-dependent receptor [Novosphingobium sp.]|uniref:TonB-dependent receptor n=1 Tax=Novosphingobium sp. TaxID=1874826 RepID=UPI00333FB2EA
MVERTIDCARMAVAVLALAIAVAEPAAVLAQPVPPGQADFPAAPLPDALRQIAARFGVSVGAEGPLPAIMTRPVHHARSAAEALARMLDHSGYVAHQIGPGLWRIEVVQAARAVPPHDDRRPAPAPATVAAGDIVVTATKTSSRVGVLPRAISVVQFGVDDQGLPANASSTVAHGTDGLVLTALGAGNNRMFLRGVADSPLNGSSQSPVAVLVDGGRLTFSAPDPDLRLVDVERVELLKGPQGSLYGTGVLGGIYQVVARPARLDRIEAMVSAGATVRANGGAGPVGSAMINLPIVRDRVGLRLVGYGERDPGWINTGIRHDTNRATVSGARADLGIAPGPGWRIDISGLAQRIRTSDSQYVYAPGTRGRPDQQAEPHLTEIAHAAFRLSGTIGGVRVDALSGYTWHRLRATLDATVGATALGAALGIDSPALFNDNRQFRMWESELRLSGQLAGVRWLIGAAHTESRDHQLRDLTGTTGGGGPGGGDNAVTGDAAEPLALVAAAPLVAAATAEDVAVDVSFRNAFDTGAFATVTLPITRHVDIEGGARAFVSVQEVQRTVEEVSGQQRTIKRGISPAGAISWHPRAGRLVFVRYGQAFRQGGLTFGEDGQVSAFAGDRLATLEAGWREDLGRLTLNAGGFVTWWNDMQADLLETTGLVETRNVGRARITGAELGMTVRLAHDWQISLGGTVQHARLVADAAGVALTNAHLPIIPDHAVRAGLDHGFALLGGQGHVRLSLRWLGPARLSFDPKLDQPTGNVLETALAASLRWGRTCLSLAIDNPLNRAGNTFAYGNPFRLATPQYTPQAPVRATAMLAYRF